MKKILYTLLISTALAGCAPTANQIAGIPPRPRISAEYQAMLMRANKFEPGIAREAQKNQWDWHNFADKMENRVKHGN